MKLMLVDDHPLFMEGLQYVLETHGIEIAGTAENGMAALEKARILKPDIILMDIKMPGADGLEALKLIKSEMPGIKVIMLTSSEEDDDLFKAIKLGASGYLLKNTHAKELVGMLSAAEKDEVPLSPGLATRILREFRNQSDSEALSSKPASEKRNSGELSDRQLEVLELVARGMTYKEVGEVLGLSERTVKYHMERIIELLNFENKSQVIAYAARKGIVDHE